MRAVEVELDGVGVQAPRAVEVAGTGHQLPAPADREDVVLPADRRLHPRGQQLLVVERLEGVEAMLADVHVLHAHDPARRLEVERVAIGALQRRGRHRWHHPVDQRVRAVDQDAGRLAGQRVALDVAVARVPRRRVDARELERTAVDEQAAPRAVVDRDRPVRQHRVQPLPVGDDALAPEREPGEVDAVDPAVARVAGRVRTDRVGDLPWRRVGDADVEVVGVARTEREVRVGVHVVQAGHREATAQIDDAGRGAEVVGDLRPVADGDEAAVPHRDGLRPRQAGVDRVDAAVDEGEVRRLAHVDSPCGCAGTAPRPRPAGRGPERRPAWPATATCP